MKDTALSKNMYIKMSLYLKKVLHQISGELLLKMTEAMMVHGKKPEKVFVLIQLMYP